MITYGRSTVTIGQQLFGKNHEMSDDDKTKAAQKVYDSVMMAYPDLKSFMEQTQERVRHVGYTETILGRRRHIPDMQLPRFEFRAMPGYVNPDIDPMDINSLMNKDEIPQRVVRELEKEFNSLKYFGQIVKRTNELKEEHIRVINNTKKIQDATRQCVNSVVQGSAADLTKMAILNLETNDRWHEIGGRLLVPVHDELICEVPMEHWEEGRDLLKEAMESAGDFLPFPINCDVEVTTRWYGLTFPCCYTKPDPETFSVETLNRMPEDELKWVQYHIFDSEYKLPVYPNKDGEKPEGDEALGVNGYVSDELEAAIRDYESFFGIGDSEFVNHIECFVREGKVRTEK